MKMIKKLFKVETYNEGVYVGHADRLVGPDPKCVYLGDIEVEVPEDNMKDLGRKEFGLLCIACKKRGWRLHYRTGGEGGYYQKLQVFKDDGQEYFFYNHYIELLDIAVATY